MWSRKMLLSVVAAGLMGPMLAVAEDSKDKPVSLKAAIECEEAASAVKTWLLVLMVVPTLLNVGSIVLLVFSMILIKRLKGIVEAISSSTHWLTRTAIRVGLGPTAKRALIEYAKGKPEFKKLLG